MAFLLAKKLSHSLQFPTTHLRLTRLPLLRLSTGAHQPQDPPFMAQYLISSFGFSPDRALKVATSPNHSPIKSHDRPEAVVRFLKETGLTDSQIKKVISWNPQLLCSSVPKTLKPRARELMDGGFTGETLIQLILLAPGVLFLKSAISRLQFWRNYTGNDDPLLRIIQKNRRLLHFDIDKVVVPNIKLLRDYGFSDADVRRVLSSLGDRLNNPDYTKKLIEKTEALGFARGSGTFLVALAVLGRRSNWDAVMRKLVFLRETYGWSEEEANTAFKKFPTLVGLSEKMLKSKMDFLIGTAGLTNQEITSAPAILGYSLERRVVPRHHVLSVLKQKGLNSGALYQALMLSEEDFLEKFVRPCEKEVPQLEEVYRAACQGKICS